MFSYPPLTSVLARLGSLHGDDGHRLGGELRRSWQIDVMLWIGERQAVETRLDD